MGAIVGILHFDVSSVNDNLLNAMLDTMPHRGSDNKQIWQEGRVGFGQRMFWTTPELQHEQLPLRSADANVVLTADARIDNRDELISALGMRKPHAEISDSEIILTAYQQWGEDCPDKLLGDFAFAIWDTNKQRIFCVRDHMGVKPFYYFLSSKLFAFATEIKALWQVPDIPQQINELQLALFISGDDDDKQATFFQNIQRLPPAHAFTISATGESQSAPLLGTGSQPRNPSELG